MCKLLFMEKHYSREKKERKESSTKGRNFATFWRIVEKLKIPHRLRFRSSRYASDTYFPSRFPQLWLYPEHLRSLQACYQTSPRFHDLFTLHPLPTPLYEFTPGLAEFHSNLQGGQSDFSPRDRDRERESCILDSIMNRIALSRSSFNWIPVWTMWHDYITIRREFVERLRRAEGTKSNKSSNIVPLPMDKFRPSTRWQRNPSVDGKRNMETSSHWTSNYRT